MPSQDSSRSARIRADQARLGLCLYGRCKDRPLPGRTLCGIHGAKIRDSVRQLRMRRVIAGTCLRCERPAAVLDGQPASLCELHLEESRTWRRLRRE